MKKLILFTVTCLLEFVIAHPQGRYSISCSVADGDTTTIYHNQPLVFSVSITNKEAYKNWQWNMAADEWIQELEANFKAGKLSEEDFNQEKEVAIKGKKTGKTDTLGTPAHPWYEQLKFYVFQDDSIQKEAWPVSRLGITPNEATAVLDENANYLLYCHMPPEIVSLIKPGSYSIKVLLGDVWSNQVKISVLPGDIPPAVLQSAEMQIRLGQYYWLTGNADKVFSYANAVLQKDTSNLEALILRGESHILKENYKLALMDFEKALQLHNKKFPGLYEPPEYLIGTIEWLQQK